MPIFSERRIARLERAATTSRVIPYLAGFTLAVAFCAAVFVEVFSPNSFDSFGDALWWAAQTVRPRSLKSSAAAGMVVPVKFADSTPA